MPIVSMNCIAVAGEIGWPFAHAAPRSTPCAPKTFSAGVSVKSACTTLRPVIVLGAWPGFLPDPFGDSP